MFAKRNLEKMNTMKHFDGTEKILSVASVFLFPIEAEIFHRD